MARTKLSGKQHTKERARTKEALSTKSSDTKMTVDKPKKRRYRNETLFKRRVMAMVKPNAPNAFGRKDQVVNNAGLLRIVRGALVRASDLTEKQARISKTAVLHIQSILFDFGRQLTRKAMEVTQLSGNRKQLTPQTIIWSYLEMCADSHVAERVFWENFVKALQSTKKHKSKDTGKVTVLPVVSKAERVILARSICRLGTQKSIGVGVIDAVRKGIPDRYLPYGLQRTRRQKQSRRERKAPQKQPRKEMITKSPRKRPTKKTTQATEKKTTPVIEKKSDDEAGFDSDATQEAIADEGSIVE